MPDKGLIMQEVKLTRLFTFPFFNANLTVLRDEPGEFISTVKFVS
jgi:hypothetical protein